MLYGQIVRNLVCCIAITMILSGCGQNSESINQKPVASESLDAVDILYKAAERYASSTTVRAGGKFEDFRNGAFRESPVSWELAKPDRVRLRVGERVAVIHGARWWSYDPVRDRYTNHPGLPGDPTSTAPYLLTDGASLPALALAARGSVALTYGDNYQLSAPWRLTGMDWKGDRPCYVLARTVRAETETRALTLWVDQDEFSIRGAALMVTRPNVESRPVWRCSYDNVRFDEPIDERQFAIGENAPGQNTAARRVSAD